MPEPDDIVDATLAAIAEGTPVDWEALGSAASSESLRAVLADLKIVAGVAMAGHLPGGEQARASVASGHMSVPP